MDRKIFKLPFTKSGVTKYQCPTCETGVLKVKADSFFHAETQSSKAAYQHEAWDPEWIEYVYSCLFECTNSACQDVVASTGRGSVTQYQNFDEEDGFVTEYEDFFIPKYFHPHLNFFKIPVDTPDEVVLEINTSFSLILIDPSSAANHVRIALEHLLTHLGIKRFITNNGKKSFLALHRRIDLLPSKYDHIKDLFFAVKWLGNAGSHSNHEVTLDDVLDSYELMIELLIEIFDNKRKKAKALAKKINKNKGPK